MIDLWQTVWQGPPAVIDDTGHQTAQPSGIAINPYRDPPPVLPKGRPGEQDPING
jgi:hypothetical protein